jgi:conjugative relaxase-like TrwC/TraI family protein
VPFFRPMGADSVAYHRETVVGRADDHPGRALDYYGSRGETPLRWGGRLAPRLGLEGEATHEQFDAVFAPGGYRDPATGEQFTRVKRPGFEWVIGPHKSVAVLGVLGRADVMHAILDAERDASLGFVEGWWVQCGGSRGREQVRTPTGGLVYAVTRHGTTRAGDPHPHDHILFPNITQMLDDKGGFKALDSAALRDITEAATMVGRLHSAWKAVELGYAIDTDQGKSGRARRWRIAGIGDEVCEIYSKRADEIARYLEERGQSSYRARNIAARATRDVKRHTGVDELMPHWQAELQQVGWSVERLAQALDDARRQATDPRPPLTEAEIDQLTAELMDPDSQFMTSHKVFNRWNLIEEIAPHLYGHNPTELERVLNRVMHSDLVVPLIGGPYTRQRTYASAKVLANEHAIAERVERLAARPGPQVPRQTIREALAAKEAGIGRRLTAGQRAAIGNICGPVGAVKVVVGVAGSGKTTALDAAARALENVGYTVIGTATSGQAARTLGADACIDTRTTRSLLWRLDHGQLTLTDRTVLVLDEAGMTADADLARILQAAQRNGATVVLVGDPRQLAPVGPGGALAATLQAHPEIVTTMGQNVRQHDAGEAAALLQVRHGDPDNALGYYLAHDRIHTAPRQLDALHHMAKTWAADNAAGHDTLMLAWRRDTVAALNRFARTQAEALGRIRGDDLVAPGGRAYAVGDQTVTLAPNYQGDLVTSQRGTITHIDHERQTLTLTTDNGRDVVLSGEQIDADHLDHGYALTVHRTQGATADRAHYLAEGGGRELAYVALSRARDRTTIHAVADDLDQARTDLINHWATTQAQDWISLTHQPHTGAATQITVEPAAIEPTSTPPAGQPHRPSHRREQIVAELARLNHGAPPDMARALATARFALDQLHQDGDDPDMAAAEQRVLGYQLDQHRRHQWLAQHPQRAQRIHTLQRQLLHIDNPDLARTLDHLDRIQHPNATNTAPGIEPPQPGRGIARGL